MAAAASRPPPSSRAFPRALPARWHLVWQVTVIHRRDEFVASRVMYQRAVEHPQVEILTNKKVKAWQSKAGAFLPELSGAVVEDTRDGSLAEVPCSGAFIAIGHVPITDFLGQQVELDRQGYIVNKEHTMTSVPGVFAAGDVVDKRYRQAITAAAMGCQAAIDAERWLEDHKTSTAAEK